MLTRRHLLAAGTTTAFAQTSRPPNIVFLLTDDQRHDALGCAGNPIVRTPNIDALAARGVRFQNAFVTTAICVTSRASIFSGLYARSHGIEQFSQQFTPAQLAATYPAILRRAGYQTAFIGKYGLDGTPLPEKSFDFWRGFPGQGKSFPQGEPGPHMTAIMTGQAREFLTQTKAGQPFCLSVSYKHPHAEDADPRQFLYDPRDRDLYKDVQIPVPRTAAPEYVRKLPVSVQRSEGRRRWAVRFSTPELYQESVRAYYRLCTAVDRSVGEILDTLRTRGLDNNTIVVYTSDNGFYLAEHGLADKWFMHEESIRIPLIVYDPRPNARHSAVETRFALNIDLAPTLLDYAGQRAPMHGRSLRPLIEGQSPAWRSEFFYEHRFRYNGWIPATEGIRDTRWKYTRYIDEKPVEEDLFDLDADKLEERNLAAVNAHATTIQRLRARHQTWSKALEAWKPGADWRDPA